ncbi:antirestriction protein ArdA [Pseudomonas sp.]|jgi:antirestriction protein|uniref:antirestriction protein ArdA n=1 Tax=Pseudomonas sp. TaxID=306 RepID=UPI0037CA171B
MRMYAACLASYNNGVLHGEWFDLEEFDDVSDLQEAIKHKVLMTSRFPNVTVECPHCETGRRGMGVAEGRNFKGFYACSHCDGYGNHPSAEEWAAHDYDGEGLSSFGEYPNLAKLLEHVRLVSEYGDAWLAYVEWQGASNATEGDFLDSSLGQCESVRDYFEERLEESGVLNEVPEELRYYIDFEQYAKDMECNGGYHFETYNGTTFVFSS